MLAGARRGAARRLLCQFIPAPGSWCRTVAPWLGVGRGVCLVCVCEHFAADGLASMPDYSHPCPTLFLALNRRLTLCPPACSLARMRSNTSSLPHSRTSAGRGCGGRAASAPSACRRLRGAGDEGRAVSGGWGDLGEGGKAENLADHGGSPHNRAWQAMKRDKTMHEQVMFVHPALKSASYRHARRHLPALIT